MTRLDTTRRSLVKAAELSAAPMLEDAVLLADRILLLTRRPTPSSCA